MMSHRIHQIKYFQRCLLHVDRLLQALLGMILLACVLLLYVSIEVICPADAD